MFHVEKVILNNEDHKIKLSKKERELYAEFIENEIHFIDVSELGEFPKFSTSNLSCQVFQKVCQMIVKTTRYSSVSLVVQ